MTQNTRHEGDRGSWDKINSTYWWKINLKPTEARPYLKGFSKKYGQNEAKDKEYLLCRIAIMLDEHGYPDRVTREKGIEIHKREGNRCRDNDPIILQLFPDTFELGEEILTNREIYRHVKEMYERRKNPKHNTQNYFGPAPKTVNPGLDKEVEIAVNATYKNIDDVYEAVRLLEDKGVARGQYVDAFKKILDKNPRLK